MKQYFEQQLKDGNLITEESLENIKKNRLKKNPKGKDPKEYIPKSTSGKYYEVGDKILFFMEEGYKKNTLRLHSVLLSELDDIMKDFKFIKQDNSIPWFKKKFIEIKD